MPSRWPAWLDGGDATFRTIRGGSWDYEPELIRSAVRFERHRKVLFDTLGLRVARGFWTLYEVFDLTERLFSSLLVSVKESRPP